MYHSASQKTDARSALAELMKSIRESRNGSRSGAHDGVSGPPPVPVRRKREAEGDRGPEGAISREDLRRERKALERRAAQLDRMEEVLQRMLRSVERREDEIREREMTAARFGLDDELKSELIRREQTVRETEARLDERERFLDESEALLLKRAREWVDLIPEEAGSCGTRRSEGRFSRNGEPG